MVASRQFEKANRPTSLPVAELVQKQADGYVAYRARKGKTYGGKVVERKDQVSELVLSKAQQKFKEGRRRKQRGEKKTSSRMPTECTLTEPSNADFWSTGGTRRRSLTCWYPVSNDAGKKKVMMIHDCWRHAEGFSNAFWRTRLRMKYWGSWAQHTQVVFVGQEGLGEAPNPCGTRSSGTKVAGVAPAVWCSGPPGDVVVGMVGLASAQVRCPGSRSSSWKEGGPWPPRSCCTRSGSRAILPCWSSALGVVRTSSLSHVVSYRSPRAFSSGKPKFAFEASAKGSIPPGRRSSAEPLASRPPCSARSPAQHTQWCCWRCWYGGLCSSQFYCLGIGHLGVSLPFRSVFSSVPTLVAKFDGQRARSIASKKRRVLSVGTTTLDIDAKPRLVSLASASPHCKETSGPQQGPSAGERSAQTMPNRLSCHRSNFVLQFQSECRLLHCACQSELADVLACCVVAAPQG